MTTDSRYSFASDLDRAKSVMIRRRNYLLRNHPEIAEQYRSGFSLAEIAQEHLPHDYEISPNVAKNSVLYALAKLLSPEEKAELGLKHKREAYKKRKDLNGNGESDDGDCEGNGKKNPKRVAAGQRAYKNGVSQTTSERLAQICVSNMIRRGIYPYESELRFVDTGLNGQQFLYPMNEKDYILFLRNQRGFTWSIIEEMVNGSFNRNGRKPRKANSIRVVYQG
jgi:hypothetical protein